MGDEVIVHHCIGEVPGKSEQTRNKCFAFAHRPVLCSAYTSAPTRSRAGASAA